VRCRRLILQCFQPSRRQPLEQSRKRRRLHLEVLCRWQSRQRRPQIPLRRLLYFPRPSNGRLPVARSELRNGRRQKLQTRPPQSARRPGDAQQNSPGTDVGARPGGNGLARTGTAVGQAGRGPCGPPAVGRGDRASGSMARSTWFQRQTVRGAALLVQRSTVCWMSEGESDASRHRPRSGGRSAYGHRSTNRR
jgi:hypothetical protein